MEPQESRSSRRTLLRAGVGAGAAGLLVSCGGSEPQPTEASPVGLPSDLAILDTLTSLEHVQADVYAALAGAEALDDEARRLSDAHAGQESDHAKALAGLLRERGATPPGRPRIARGRLLDGSAQTLLNRTVALEALATSAYLGQLAALRDPDVLSVVVSIYSVECRQAAAWAAQAGASPLPAHAFARPSDLEATQRGVRRWLA